MDQADLWREWRRERAARAFEALVRPELAHALALARRMGADAGEAEDALQESLVQLAREKTDDPVRVGLRAWLCRRVVLRVKMQARAGSRRRRHEAAAARPGRATHVADVEARDEVEAALGRLDEDERRAVVLRFLHDLDYREMAYVLAATENACRIRVHKALKKLRGLLGVNAPALLAALGLPAAKADAAIVAGALAAAKPTAGLAAKGALAAALALAVTATICLAPAAPPPPAPPPAVVAAAAPPAAVPLPPPRPPEPPPAPTGIDLLARHLDGREDLSARLWDFDDLAAIVRPAEGPVHRIEAKGAVRAVRPEELDGPVVEFGPGTFVLPRAGWERESLVLRGAGPDATVLVGGPILLEGSIGHLHIRDLTWDGAALDVRGAVAAVLERVRLRGWTITAGYGAPLGATGRALLLLRDCAFVGGFKRNAGGCALNVRGGVVALFDRCRLSDLDEPARAEQRAHPRSLVHFRRCVLSGCGPPRRVATASRECVEARATPRARLSDLRAVAEAFELAGERVAGVDAIAWDGAEATVYAVHAGGRTFIVDRAGRPVPDGAEYRVRSPRRAYDGPPLTLALSRAWPRLDPEMAAAGVREDAEIGPGGAMLPRIHVVDPLDRTLAVLDPATGAVAR